MAEEKTPLNYAEAEKIEIPLDFELYHYTVDQNGNWSKKMISNWGHKEIITGQTWVIVQERLNAAKERVLSGKTSPIDYLMVKCVMDVKLCAQFTGLPKRKVRKHLKPSAFNALSHDVLKKYADAFEVSVEELRNFKDKLKETSQTEA
jgi:hypothetical protein